MAKQPKTRSNAAIAAERESPGWKAVRSQAEKAPPARSSRFSAGFPERGADAVLPPMQQLRRKYLGDEAAEAEPDTSAAMDSSVSEATEIVELESGELRKSVGVRHGKVVWRQG